MEKQVIITILDKDAITPEEVSSYVEGVAELMASGYNSSYGRIDFEFTTNYLHKGHAQ